MGSAFFFPPIPPFSTLKNKIIREVYSGRAYLYSQLTQICF